jgi:predicted Zn-dependent protease
MRRPGWRDLPRRGPTELLLSGTGEVAAGELLAELGAGAYLVAPEGGLRLDGDGDRFALPVSGYAFERGGAPQPLGPALLTGRLSDWLAGIRALARDVAWVPGAALFGAPSALVEGLELTARD